MLNHKCTWAQAGEEAKHPPHGDFEKKIRIEKKIRKYTKY
jgi:hypothetical protein